MAQPPVPPSITFFPSFSSIELVTLHSQFTFKQDHVAVQVRSSFSSTTFSSTASFLSSSPSFSRLTPRAPYQLLIFWLTHSSPFFTFFLLLIFLFSLLLLLLFHLFLKLHINLSDSETGDSAPFQRPNFFSKQPGSTNSQQQTKILLQKQIKNPSFQNPAPISTNSQPQTQPRITTKPIEKIKTRISQVQMTFW